MTEPHLAQPVLTTPEKPTWWKNRKFWTVVGVILAIALAAGRFVLREHRAEERSRHSAEKELDSFAVGDCVTMSQGKERHRPDQDWLRGGPELHGRPAYRRERRMLRREVHPVQHHHQGCGGGEALPGEESCCGALLSTGRARGSTQLVDCAKAGENAYRVVQRFELDDEKRCPEDTTPSRYSAPPRTYCLALPTG